MTANHDGNKPSGIQKMDQATIELMNADTSRIHPLLIDHVLHRIFGYFNWDYLNPDLRTCRSVCKTWCDIITTRMKLLGKERKFTFHKPEDGELLTRLVNDMENTMNLPFQEFEFKEHFFVAQNTAALIAFCQSLGRHVETLKMSIGKQYTADFMKLLGRNVECDSLKTLSIICTGVETMPMPVSSSKSTCTWLPQPPDTQAAGILILLQTILERACSLKNFKFIVPPNYVDGHYRPIAHERFGETLSTFLPDTCTSIQVFMRLQEGHIEEMIKYKLEELDLEFYGKEVSERSFKGFLESQENTLKSLRILDYDCLHGNSASDFPQFPKVKTLQIKKVGDSFSFLKSFPKLERLVFLNSANAKAQMSTERKDSEEVECSTLTTLDIQFILESPNFIESSFACFPNLKTLKVFAAPVSKDATEKIFELGSELEEFHISFMESFKGQVVDPLITGMPLSTCLRVREEDQYNRPEDCMLPLGSRPCLTKLRNLRKFVIDSGYKSVILTDVSIRYGLFLMPFLEEVVICFKDHEISRKCLTDLRKRVRLREGKEEETGAELFQDSPELQYALVPYIG